MRVSLQPSFILHRRPYRDSSMLLEVLTAEQGRISLVARGARRKTRGGSGSALLQPYIPLLLVIQRSHRPEKPECRRGRRQAAARCAASACSAACTSMSCWCGCCIATTRIHSCLPPTHPALEALAGSDEVDDVLRRFEFALLGELGYGFDLDLDGHSGEAVQPELWYHYDPERGLVARGPDGGPGPARIQGRRPAGHASNDFSGAARPTAKRLLRQALALQLGDAPLRSRDLFRAACQRGASAPMGAAVEEQH